MQPYQEATQEIKRQGEAPVKTLGTAASIIGTAAIGGLSLNKIVPFLSKYIPEDLAIKGLIKADPRFGNFIQKALGSGKSFDEVKDFIKSKAIGDDDKKNGKAVQQKNIIEEHAPNLYEIVKEKIGQGFKPLEVAKNIAKEGRFSKEIADLQKKTGNGWGSIVSSVFGNEQFGEAKRQESLKNFNEIKNPSTIQQETERFKTEYPQQVNGDQALLAALDKILKM